MSFNPDYMKVNSPKDSNYKSGDVKTRPSTDPKSRKDFKKVLEKGGEDEEDENAAVKELIEETDGIAISMKEETKKKAPPSLFDLTSGKKTSFEKDSGSAVKTVESPADIYTKMSSTDSKKTMKENLVETSDHPLFSIDKDKFTTRFSTEQPDLSYVNPLAATTNQAPSVNLSISTEKLVIPVSNIQEIINQMIQKVTEMKHSGQTDTIVTLKNPPLFEGATIIVSAFDSAKNEFNITIENLTQAGKQLLDQQGNKEQLLLALEQKGYAVHILTTTTLVENRPVDNLPQEEETNRQSREEQQDRQNNNRDQT